MVLNGRKQMTQFTKEEKISGLSGLKQSLLLYVVMWSLYHSLYTSLHLFPRMSCLYKGKKLSIFQSWQNAESATKWSSLFAASSSVASHFYNGLCSWLCSSAFTATLRAGRVRPSNSCGTHQDWVFLLFGPTQPSPPSHQNMPLIKSEPEKRVACLLLC